MQQEDDQYKAFKKPFEEAVHELQTKYDDLYGLFILGEFAPEPKKEKVNIPPKATPTHLRGCITGYKPSSIPKGYNWQRERSFPSEDMLRNNRWVWHAEELDTVFFIDNRGRDIYSIGWLPYDLWAIHHKYPMPYAADQQTHIGMSEALKALQAMLTNRCNLDGYEVGDRWEGGELEERVFFIRGVEDQPKFVFNKNAMTIDNVWLVLQNAWVALVKDWRCDDPVYMCLTEGDRNVARKLLADIKSGEGLYLGQWQWLRDALIAYYQKVASKGINQESARSMIARFEVLNPADTLATGLFTLALPNTNNWESGVSEMKMEETMIRSKHWKSNGSIVGTILAAGREYVANRKRNGVSYNQTIRELLEYHDKHDGLTEKQWVFFVDLLVQEGFGPYIPSEWQGIAIAQATRQLIPRGEKEQTPMQPEENKKPPLYSKEGFVIPEGLNPKEQAEYVEKMNCIISLVKNTPTPHQLDKLLNELNQQATKTEEKPRKQTARERKLEAELKKARADIEAALKKEADAIERNNLLQHKDDVKGELAEIEKRVKELGLQGPGTSELMAQYAKWPMLIALLLAVMHAISEVSAAKKLRLEAKQRRIEDKKKKAMAKQHKGVPSMPALGAAHCQAEEFVASVKEVSR